MGGRREITLSTLLSRRCIVQWRQGVANVNNRRLFQVYYSQNVTMAGAKPFVDAKLAQRKVLLFSKSYCPDSKTARDILDSYKMSPQTYEVVEIEKRQDCTQIENYFQILCLTDSRSVPQLFIDGKYIGGYKDIPRFHECGQLKTLLQTASAL